MRKAIVYYTDFNLPPMLADLCAAQLIYAAGEIPIHAVSLGRPAGFGRQLVLIASRGILTMHRQILAGLSAAEGDTVFLCEHDVLYHPSHFAFEPARPDTFYYNINVWHTRYPDGHSVFYDAQQVSGLCANRDLLIDFYRQRIQQIEMGDPVRHFEPGLRQTVGGQLVDNWQSLCPNLDVRHGSNMTGSKWSPADFRNSKYAAGWREADEVDGWGRVADVLKGVTA